MPVFTVRQLLADVARPILVGLTTDPELPQAERSVATNAIPIVDAVLGDLNQQNVIPQAGRRNAAVTNLRDQVETPLAALDRAHQTFGAGRLYNCLDAVSICQSLIAAQLPSDEVTF